jgi:hypothetical protein
LLDRRADGFHFGSASAYPRGQKNDARDGLSDPSQESCENLEIASVQRSDGSNVSYASTAME